MVYTLLLLLLRSLLQTQVLTLLLLVSVGRYTVIGSQQKQQNRQQQQQKQNYSGWKIKSSGLLQWPQLRINWNAASTKDYPSWSYFDSSWGTKAELSIQPTIGQQGQQQKSFLLHQRPSDKDLQRNEQKSQTTKRGSNRMTRSRQNDVAIDHQSSSEELSSPTITTTRLTGLCEAFRKLRQDEEGDSSGINVPILLQACRFYEQIMNDMGHTQSAKDLHSNIEKVRVVSDAVPQYNNIKSLLLYEKSLGIHKPNGILKDPSCAMGLLWIRRSIAFQCELYRLLLDCLDTNQNSNDGSASSDVDGVTVVDLTLMAYQNVLEAYHGWAFQKMYRAGIKITTPPSKRQLLAELGGYTNSIIHDDASNKRNHDSKSTSIHTSHSINENDNYEQMMSLATRRDMQELVHLWQPLLERWTRIFVELDLEDIRKAPI